MSYVDSIKKISPLSLDDIIKTAKQHVPDAYRCAPWNYPGLNHGTALLQNEEQLCCYLSAYGDMHKGKLRGALSHFPFKKLDKNLEIIDWGCGQGLASVYMIDCLRYFGFVNKLKKVTLIEPSSTALSRAKVNVIQAIGEEDVYVEALNCYLPSIDVKQKDHALGGLHIEEPICIHFFSNILDIPEIDLKELSLLVSSSGYRHYFVCVGPVNFGNDRLSSFPRYFNIHPNDTFVDFKSAQYRQLPNGKWYSCIAKGFQIVREEGKPFLVPLSYYPPKQFHGAFRLDVIESIDKTNPNSQRYWNEKSSFEVLAPFDIGASIYEDIDPILAVLSNIVTRGLPTKCSPYIEDKLNELFDFSELTEEYGTIRYKAKSKMPLPNEQLLREIPIAIARIEKVIIEAVLTNRISLSKEEWNVVVKENDVPCSAIAFADLAQMYNHLTALTADFQDKRFPKVNLHIISKEYASSPLHLDSKAFANCKQADREKNYDMVIDFSLHDKVDAVNVNFSEFKSLNDCYFNVRSSACSYTPREIYTTDRIIYQPLTMVNENGGHSVIKKSEKHLVYFLQLLFRKKGFRAGQLPILNRALQIKSVIGLLPTGGGKSLTYQMAAMLQPGVTIIIDPLKSLMQDQYDGLITAGIDCCTYINSELEASERAAHELMLESSQVIFTFMSPERLCIYEFRERLQNMENLHVYFSYGVIDEVHCVSEWGQDFRFSYLHLGRNLYSYVKAKNGSISLFGLTATASFDVLSDVERELSGNGAFALEPDTIVRYENSNRLELQYKVEKIEVEYKNDSSYNPTGSLATLGKAVNIGDTFSVNDQKAQFLYNYIKKIPSYVQELQTEESIRRILSRFEERENLEDLEGSQLYVDMPDNFYEKKEDYKQAGIIFCPHVNSTGISVNVNSQNLSRLCEVGTFSGSDKDGDIQGNDSMEYMKKFRENKLPLMVATKAFGMGIDKPNVRFTINMNYSSSLESFVQEAGRAGRDRKMALSIILISDYVLYRISDRCQNSTYPITIIKNKWFKENDLREILDHYKVHVNESDFDICTPLTDIVRLKCNTDNTCNASGQEVKDKEGNTKRQYWKCIPQCSRYKTCSLKYIDKDMQRKWFYIEDLKRYLAQNNIRVPKENLEYQGADYNTVMYFFDNNFKGEFEEKKKMNYLLSEVDLEYFIGNDKKDKPGNHIQAKGFLSTVLSSSPGTEVVSIISYQDDSYADIAKAIYRMCIIGLVDDFTQDYATQSFRILSTRKKNGSYYERLKEFLMRYYSEERAENEVEKASVRKGQNEIHKCLGYLTEFIYDKVALKRKRAIDDIRNFCNVGIDTTSGKNWLEINEDLKDEIYYYFNSKYAREGYKTDNDEDFSLLDETERGKVSSTDILFKFMRVVDADVMGVSGSPKDSVKHLQGAVRLIRRGIADTNATLSMLNAFCLIALRVNDNQHLMQELDKSYIEGYQSLKEEIKDYDVFFNCIRRFKDELNNHNRNLASTSDIEHLNELDMIAELTDHDAWIERFTNNYTK